MGKNDLENTLYSFKNAVDDEKLAALIDESDKTAVTTACDDALSWLDSNANAEASEFKAKPSEVEAVVKPIMAKVQAAAGAAGGMPGGMPCGMPGGAPAGAAPSSSGPKIEEVD